MEQLTFHFDDYEPQKGDKVMIEGKEYKILGTVMVGWPMKEEEYLLVDKNGYAKSFSFERLKQLAGS